MSQGIIFTFQFAAVAVTAQQDFAEINVPATGVVYLHSIEFSQSNRKQDAQEEFFDLRFKTGMTTSGSGGTTPTAHNGQGVTYGGTVEVNNTTKATGGTIVTRRSWTWNIRNEFIRIFTPEERPRIAPSARGVIELATTPTASTTCSGVIVFEVL